MTTFQLPSRPSHQRAALSALALALTAALALPQQAQAAAFQLPVGNAASYGRAFGGGSLWQDDPSAAYSNPAAMAWIDKMVTQGSWIGIDPDIQFRGNVTNAYGQKVDGSSPNGGHRVKSAGSGFTVVPISDRFALGLSFTAPYALTTKYNEYAKFKQFGTMTSIRSMSLGLSTSFKVSDSFALGFGMTAQRTRGQLNTSTDLGSASALALQQPPGYRPGDEEARIHIRVHNWSYGYFLGMEWKPTEWDSLGLSYHSRVGNRLNGRYSMYYSDPTARALVAQGIPLANGLNSLFGRSDLLLPALNANGSPASAALDLPAFINLDYLHKFSERFTLGASLQWTQWSSFRKLNLDSKDQRLVSLPENYRNAYMLSLGGDYKLDEQWTLRGGFTYDETPTKTSTRETRIPDNNRKVVAVGVGYQATRHLGLDFGYQHQFMSHASIHDTNVYALGKGKMDGYTKDSGNVYVVSGTYRF